MRAFGLQICLLGLIVVAFSLARADDGLNLLDAAYPGEPVGLLASTDAKHQNRDYLLLKPGESRTVVTFPQPTTVTRLWFTASQPENITVTAELERASSRNTLARNGEVPPGKAWHFRNLRMRSLRVSNRASASSKEENKFFYQLNTLPGNIHSQPRHKPLSIIHIEHLQKEVRCPRGRTVEVYKFNNRGVITALECDTGGVGVETLKHVVLTMTWDFDKRPAVMVPLAPFFAQYYAMTDFRSSFLQCRKGKLSLRLPMPFSQSATIGLSNQSAKREVKVKLSVAVASVTDAPGFPPYRFCATYASQETVRDEPFLLLKTEGEGTLLGCSIGFDGLEHRTLSFLEGNDQIAVDGNALEGTGAEDFFNAAWFFAGGVGAHELDGVTYRSDSPPKVSAFRFLREDRIPFRQSAKFAFQHGSRNSAPDCFYESVVYWYQKPPIVSLPGPQRNEETKIPTRELNWLIFALIVAVVIFRVWQRRRKVSEFKASSQH